MFSERTSVGLDVHARSTTAWALDCEAGEIFSERLVADTDEVVAWVARLPQPAAVAYEAGANGFVLARALQTAGIRCVVAAPSKMERPAGDRIKTDRRDARRPAKLLRLIRVLGPVEVDRVGHTGTGLAGGQPRRQCQPPLRGGPSRS